MRIAKVLGKARLIVGIMAEGLCLALLAASLASSQAAAAEAISTLSSAGGSSPSYQGAPIGPPREARSLLEQPPRGASFLGEPASLDARQVADWVVDSGDNRSLPFVIIDKVNAKVFVFDDHGQLLGAARALLGLARGDDTVPGIGHRKLSTMRPDERTTPAGRFVAALGHDFEQDILWVDYDAGIALHRVKTFDPKDHRFQRLASASSLDKRISYGCINVPVKFYDNVVIRAFTGTNGIVYILPETKPIGKVFAIHDGEAHSRGQGLSRPTPAS